MSRFLITGSKGFIGRHLVRFLGEREAGHSITAVGREFDLTDARRVGELFQAFGSFNYIIHLADVQGNARWSAENAAAQFLANSKMSLNVLEAWTRWQPQARLICFSSLWAYPEEVTDAAEKNYWNGRMHRPTEHYGLNKKFLGVGLEACKRQHGLKGTVLVLGSVYGPEDATTHVIPSLMNRMRQNSELLEIWGDGTETRDFIYIEDQLQGIVQHLDHEGELLNIGSGCSSSIHQIVEILVRLMDYKGRVVFDPSKASGAANRRLNTGLAAQTTGWPGRFKLHTLEEGLQKTVNSFRKSNG
ncbi:MAG: NAD-dependent epimerase/dehydratase family protein [Limisphaerales bacterium]